MEKFNKLKNKLSKGEDQKSLNLLTESQFHPFRLEAQEESEIPTDNFESQHQRFSKLFDLAPVSYFVLDSLGVIEEVNRTGIELFGLTKLALQNKRFQNFISSEDLESFNLFLKKMRINSQKRNTEITFILPNKKIIYAHIEGVLIKESSFKTNYYLTINDITLDQKEKVELIEIKNRLDITLTACSTGTWRIENGGGRITLDEYSHEILGLPPSSFQGTLKDSIRYVQSNERLNVLKTVLQALKVSNDLDIEFQIITKCGYKKDIHSKGRKVILPNGGSIFVGIMIDVTAQKKLLAEAEELKINQQKDILTATLGAQENERNNISRALHDSVCQILYGIKVNLQCIPELKHSKTEWNNVNKLLDQAIKETRDISYALTPSVLKDFGFTAGIKEISQRLSTASFKINTIISSSLDQLNSIVQLYLFRIIQELINNCIKHAAATEVYVIIKEEKEKIKAIVSDNGKGFKTGITEAFKNGSGLRSIKNQIFLLNGELIFKSNEKRTTVCLTFKKNIEF